MLPLHHAPVPWVGFEPTNLTVYVSETYVYTSSTTTAYFMWSRIISLQRNFRDPGSHSTVWPQITKFLAAVSVLQKTKCSRPRLAVASEMATSLRLAQVHKNLKRFRFLGLCAH